MNWTRLDANPILFSPICEPDFLVNLSTTGSQESGGETRCGLCSALGTVPVSDVLEPGDQRGGETRREWQPRGLGQCRWTPQDYEGKEEQGACGHVECGGKEGEWEGAVSTKQLQRQDQRMSHCETEVLGLTQRGEIQPSWLRQSVVLAKFSGPHFLPSVQWDR